jgi:hypothetical protein
MSYRPKGKHVSVDSQAPEALGMCDYTQFVHERKDLVRQMEYRGDDLVWTGLYVGRQYLDVPNDQLRPPIVAPDPVPVPEPRVQQGSGVILPQPQVPAVQAFNNLENYGWSAQPQAPTPVPDGDFDGVPALPENVREQILRNYAWTAN